MSDVDMIDRLKPEECSCSWELIQESLVGEPGWMLSLVAADRRCRVHGKPRHKTLAGDQP